MNSPSAKEVFFSILEPGAYGGNPEHWDEAMAARIPSPPYLDKSSIPAKALASALTQEHIPALSAMADEIAADPGLQAFAWYMHWRVFVAPENGQPWGAPSLLKKLGPRAGLFYQLLSLEWEGRLRAFHRRLGLPESVTRETLEQVASYEANHRRGRGGQGMYENQFPWFATYLMGPYVKLGRFEYQHHAYGGGVEAWRRKKDGALLLLAEEGRRFSEPGLCMDSKAPEGEGWKARLVAEAGAVRGHPISPLGYALKKEIRLPRPEWEPYLKKGDTVLDLHIPAGGKMDWEAITDSLRKAGPFFATHFPKEPWKALVVTTWFMDPRLPEVLGADTNPVLFQRAAHLYPTGPDPESVWFVFLAFVNRTPLDQLPSETSMQKKMIAFMKSGRTWHGGGFLMLPEDVANPKLDAYRDRFAALSRELSI